MSKKIELGIIDWDDTCILGSTPVMYGGFKEALASVGIHVPQDELIERLVSRWGCSHIEQLSKLLEEQEIEDSSILKQATESYESFLGTKLPDVAGVVPGCIETLERLKKVGGTMLGLNTAAPREILTETIMPQLDFPEDVFDFIETADTLGPNGKGKPHAYANLKIMAAAQVEPEQTFTVGDSKVDVEAGRNAGITNNIVVCTGQLTVAHALDLGVPRSHIIPNISDLELALNGARHPTRTF